MEGADQNLLHRLAGKADVIRHLPDDQLIGDWILLGIILIDVLAIDRQQIVGAGNLHPAFLRYTFDDVRRQFLAGIEQRPCRSGRYEEDIDILKILVVGDGVLKHLVEKILSHPRKIAAFNTGLQLYRGFDDVIGAWRPEVTIGLELAGLRRHVDSGAHHLALAENSVEKSRKLALRKLQVHVRLQVGLEDPMTAIDEVDVLNSVFLGEGLHLLPVETRGARRRCRDLGSDLRQHPLHMGLGRHDAGCGACLRKLRSAR